MTGPDLNGNILNNRAVIQDVSIKIWPGQFVAVVGPNGGGKTTLLREARLGNLFKAIVISIDQHGPVWYDLVVLSNLDAVWYRPVGERWCR